MVYQLDGDDEQNRMQVKFHPRVKLMSLGSGQGSNIIKFRLPYHFQSFLYQSLCVFSQIKDRKHIEQNFHSVAKVMPRGGTVGCWSICLSVCLSVMLSPPKPQDEIQPNLVCELLT